MSTLAAYRRSFAATDLRVILQLAVREGRRLVRHPIYLVGAVLSLAFFGLLTWNLAPVLHREDGHSIGALLPLAAATLIVANLASIRAARDGTEELYEGVPTGIATRTLAHLLSLAWAVAGAAVLLIVMFLYLALDDPVGTPRPSELAVGPATVLLFGCLGILLGRWKHHVAIAPIALVLLIALEIMLIQPVVGYEISHSRLPWLAPWVPTSLTSGVPPELVARPADWHLLYLCGLIVVAGAGAVLRHGVRRRVMAVLIAGALVAGIGGAAQLRPLPKSQRLRLLAQMERPEEFQICDGRNGFTYCAYPAYVPWIDRWAAAIEGALEAVPEEDRPTGLVVRQTFGDYFEGHVDIPGGAIRRLRRQRGSKDLQVGFEWGRWSSEGYHELGLNLSVAMRPVGLPTARRDITLTETDVALFKKTYLPQFPKRRRAAVTRNQLQVGNRWTSCHTFGQARAVIALWLAGQATPNTEASMRQTDQNFPYGITVLPDQRAWYYNGPFSPLYAPTPGNPDWGVVQWTDAEFRYAVQLLHRPDDDVATAIRADWDELTDPAASTDIVVERFGLDPLPSIAALAEKIPEGYESASSPPSLDPNRYVVGIPPCH